MKRLALIVVASCLYVTAGCEQKPAAPTAGSGSGDAAESPLTGSAKSAAGRDEHGHEHLSDSAKARGGHGGEVIEWATRRIGPLTVGPPPDRGKNSPGGDPPSDAGPTPADGTPATVVAVRFWIGTEDARGSVKAKADIEDPKQPNHWHTHTEVPDPLPDGSKLWVEIETDAGKTAGFFDLQQ